MPKPREVEEIMAEVHEAVRAAFMRGVVTGSLVTALIITLWSLIR